MISWRPPGPVRSTCLWCSSSSTTGRYLMISASRPGCYPLNNSGIWTRFLTAPWDSDFHLDMDLSMRYWGVEVCNLPECHEPVFDLIARLRERGPQGPRASCTGRGASRHTASPTAGSTPTRWGACGTAPSSAAWPGSAPTSGSTTCSVRIAGSCVRRRGRCCGRRHSSTWTCWWRSRGSGRWVSGPSVSPENFYITPAGMDETAVLGPPTSYEAGGAPYVAQGKVGDPGQWVRPWTAS